MDDEKDDKQLPANIEDGDSGDGFGASDEQLSRGPIEKFVDGDWTTGGVPSDRNRRLVGVATDVIIRRWQAQRVIEEITAKPLPDLDLLNETVPKSVWELDLNGNPRPPYERAHVLHLLDLDTAERTTFFSATAGAAIAVSRLKDKVIWKRRMHQNNKLVPQIELTWAPMNTRFGMRKRPEFKVVGWIDLSSGGGGLPPASGPKPLPPVQPKKVEEPSTAEALNDDLPF
jgi:hypothetical protein